MSVVPDPVELSITPSPLVGIRQLPQRRIRGPFLRGPISMDWLGRAARLPGKALAIAVAIWHQVGIEKTNRIRLRRRPLELLGIGRGAAYRGLAALEGEGLVIVERRRGARPHVTVLYEDAQNYISR